MFKFPKEYQICKGRHPFTKCDMFSGPPLPAGRCLRAGIHTAPSRSTPVLPQPPIRPRTAGQNHIIQSYNWYPGYPDYPSRWFSNGWVRRATTLCWTTTYPCPADSPCPTSSPGSQTTRRYLLWIDIEPTIRLCGPPCRWFWNISNILTCRALPRDCGRRRSGCTAARGEPNQRSKTDSECAIQQRPTTDPEPDQVPSINDNHWIYEYFYQIYTYLW